MLRSINRWFVLGTMVLATPALARDRQPSHPAGNPGSWFTDADYPAEAKRAGQQGRVSVRVSIDEAGAVRGCEVTGSSGSAVLDAKTCELIAARGKFVPARDERGKPVASTYSISTRWALRDDVPSKLEGPWRVAATLQIDPAGKLASCKDERSGTVSGAPALCLQAKEMPAEFGLFARGGATAALVEIVTEYSMSFDGVPAPAMVSDAPGRDTLKMAKIHFTVDTAGNVQNCQVIAQSGPGMDDLCAKPAGPFLPMEKARGVTITMAISRPSVR